MKLLDTPNWFELKSIPNLISLCRLVFIPYLAYLISVDNWPLATGLAVLLGFSDFVDGWVARRFNMRTELGALLDPLIDRIFISAVLVAMLWSDVISVWILTAIIGRDFLLLVVNSISGNKLAVNVVYVGKMGTWFLFVSFALLFVNQLFTSISFAGFSSAAIVWSVIIYWLAGWHYFRDAVKR